MAAAAPGPARKAFGVKPDILVLRQTVNNGVQPLAARWWGEIYDTFMAAGGPDYVLEFARLHLLGPHPAVCAVGLATLTCWRRTRWAAALAQPRFGERRPQPARRAMWPTSATTVWRPGSRLPLHGEPATPYQVAMDMLKGLYVRYGGDTIQLAPPFIQHRRR